MPLRSITGVFERSWQPEADARNSGSASMQTYRFHQVIICRNPDVCEILGYCERDAAVFRISQIVQSTRLCNGRDASRRLCERNAAVEKRAACG